MQRNVNSRNQKRWQSEKYKGKEKTCHKTKWRSNISTKYAKHISQSTTQSSLKQVMKVQRCTQCVCTHTKQEVTFLDPDVDEDSGPGLANNRFPSLSQSGGDTYFSSVSTVLPDGTNHFLDKNSNQDAGPVSSPKVDSLNNLTGASPDGRSLSLGQNLNLTLGCPPGPAGGLSPSGPPPQPQALRPPSLSFLSPLNKPDPSEVDDRAPLTADSDSNSISCHDVCVDPDLLNGNIKLACETNGTIVT